MIRLLGAALRTGLAGRLPLMETLVLQHRVWPTDLNLGAHMDNVRYLQLMDLARTEFLLRTGITSLVLRRRWSTPVAHCDLQYRRSLGLGQRFTLQTRLVGWDERRFLIRQRFLREDCLVAEGLVRSAVLGPEGVIAPAQCFSALVGVTLAPTLGELVTAP